VAAIVSQAVVLKSAVSGESDAIVTFYTRQAGKLRAVAKGAKRSQKRFMNCLDLFGLVEAGLVRTRSQELLRVESCRLISRPDLSAEPLRLGLAGLAVELVLVFCPDLEPDEDLFAALTAGLAGLAGRPEPAHLGLAFCFRLLARAGFGPNLENCLVCQRPLDSLDRAGLALDLGGLACSACRPQVRQLSLGAIKAARLCQQIQPAALGRIRFPPAELSRLFGLLAAYLERTAGREIRSLGFLGEVGLKI